MTTEQNPAGGVAVRVEAIVGQRELYSRMIRLAADLLRKPNMPDVETWPWPAGASQKLWRRACKDEEAAREQCRLWGIAVKELADEMMKLRPNSEVSRAGAGENDGK